MSYSFTDSCRHDYKKLLKKYRSLASDIERFCKITLKLEEDPHFPLGNKNYALRQEKDGICDYKAKMFCTTLRGNKFRVIYARHAHSIEFIFLELYIKSESDREDMQRIHDYLASVRT